jgi:hypothetical protein
MEPCAYLVIWGFTPSQFGISKSVLLNLRCNTYESWSNYGWPLKKYIKELQYDGLCTTLNIILHDYFFEKFWLRGAQYLFYSYMCSWFRNVSRNQLNGSLDDFFTYIFTNSSGSTFAPYVSSIDLSYNQFSGNLMGLNGSGAFQTAASLEVL